MPPPRLVTVATLAVFGLVLVLHDRTEPTSATDSETVTWGATDPSWSPDGNDLAFSLFGSIWRVSARGGEAEQLTSSAGYHAHPAWSPSGATIAFVQGEPPRGRMPNVPGRLMILDLASGRTQEIKTSYPLAGTPVWSPDSRSIVCGLETPDDGVLLHEIAIAGSRNKDGLGDGKDVPSSRQLHQRPRRPADGPPASSESWIDAAWSGKNQQIYFTAKRGGPPQVWSMAAGRQPIVVQTPLTRYRHEDIVLPHSLSAIPDGSGIIYSADVVNGKGDYELYRIPAEGAEPVNITNTPRDEFAPAVSPDGKTVAHVSNHLGNIDLFTMPIGGGEKKHVRISGLKFRGRSGDVRVRVLDERGAPSAVQLFVRASDGKAYYPSGSPIYYYPLDPAGTREGFFIAGGDDTFPAPAGRLRLVAVKGIEYEIAERTIQVAPGQTTEVTIQLERWTNWNQRGWYTGDNHFHANYNGSYYQRPQQSLAWLSAVDLNSANMVVANSEGAFIHDKEFFRGAVDPLSTEKRVLYWGQEYRNTNPFGHMGFLNIRQLVMPSFTSMIGSDSPYDFPLNTMAARRARQQGGFVTYMHAMGGAAGDVFDGGFSAREIPLTAALGELDAVDILPLFGGNPYELWYRLLNCGFRLSPGAGTDTFTNYRGITRLPGMVREYVEAGTSMNWQRWIERYREGRAFVTNAPLLTFDVNGQPMGSLIRVAGTEPYRAKLKTEVMSRVPLRRIEFLRNGKVIAARDIAQRERSVRFEEEVMVDRSAWFAVRVTGLPSRGVYDGGIPRAHSGAVYVHVGDQAVLVRQDLELMVRWIDRLWAYLERRDNFGSDANRVRAGRMFDEARKHYQEKLAAAG